MTDQPDKKRRRPSIGTVAEKIYRLRLATDRAAADAAQRVRFEYAKREKELLESLPENEQGRAIAMANAAIDAAMVTEPAGETDSARASWPIVDDNERKRQLAQYRDSDGLPDDEPEPQFSPRLLENQPPVEGVEVNRETGKARRIGART